MSDLIARTAKLLPRTKRIKPVPGFATAYSYEAEGPGTELGNLYVVIEVMTSFKQAEAVADLVIETVGNQYYNVDAKENETPLTRFENAIKATNQGLATYTNNGNASWVGRMSAVLAVLVGHELHITQSGSAEAYLYRGNVTSHVTTELQDKGPHRPINTFAHIASGQLEVHDRVFMATPALFHLIPRPQLKTLINDNSATGAVQKLSDLIGKSSDSDRVAAIAVEMTTAELMALQVQKDEPEEAQVGQTDKPLEVARALAVPAAASMVATTKVVGAKVVEHAPKLKSLGWQIADLLRTSLRSGRGKRNLAIGMSAIIISAIGLNYIGHRRAGDSAAIKQYNVAYQDYAEAASLAAQGNKTQAQTDLNKALTELASLAKAVKQPSFDRTLASHAHPAADPASVVALQSKVRALTNQIDGLVHLQDSVLANLSSLKNAKPTQLELVGNKLIMVDSQNNSSIYSYDLVAKKLTTVVASPKNLGHVIATTPSADSTGLYLLTDQPNVWFFKTLDSSLSAQTISFGNWPKGRAIASYGNNLYILASDGSQVYKHVPTAGGFGSATAYFKDASTVGTASSLAVDGSIYLCGQDGIRLFISGKLTQSVAAIPTGLKNPIGLRSFNDTNNLFELDGISHHIGIFAITPSAITLSKQLVFKGTPEAATVDAKSSIIYAIVDGKLVSAALPQ